MNRQVSERSAQRLPRGFIGRSEELATLDGLLQANGPRVMHVYGIPGSGKTRLLGVFAERARQAGATVVKLDCRAIEPTVTGFLRELEKKIGGHARSSSDAACRLGGLGTHVLLVLDTYEVYRLMDTWLRQTFQPQVPDNVALLCLGRERPLAAWRAAPGLEGHFHTLALGPLADNEAISLLSASGVPPNAAARIARATHGHPLALQLAAAAYAERPDLAFEKQSLQQALEELTQMFLADVNDPIARRSLEACSVIRRTTISLLRAVLPDLAPGDAFDRLRSLPFVDVADDGLVIHDAVREAIARSLRARDPSCFLGYQKAAWQQLIDESSTAGRGELWRYTADMLYLIENPVVREAFFPSGTQSLAVEPAMPADGEAVQKIISAQEGVDAARHLLQWWRRRPDSFSVVRGSDDQVVGLCCKFLSGRVEPGWLGEDPLTAEWCKHLAQHPLDDKQNALFCRRWLSFTEGESPSREQAALWIDLKRTYMELRPALRRVYITVQNLAAYAPVASRLGFDILEGQEVAMDGSIYHSAVLDFGPASVDGWLAELAAAELGITQVPLFDREARELIVDSARIALTPLEFGVMRYLTDRQGKAVSRSDLLKHVWDTQYFGGSNVVDTVVRSLRGKLGPYAKKIEAVTGVGYRLRL